MAAFIFFKAIPRGWRSVATSGAQMVAGMLIPMKARPVAPHFLWTLLSNAATVAALSVGAARTNLRG
jgi:hypothetical protein